MTSTERKARCRQVLEDLRQFNAVFGFGPDDNFICEHDGTLPPDLEARLDEAIDDIEHLCVNIEFDRLMQEGRGPN